MNKKILKLTPVFKDYIWGGNKLKTDFNKKTLLNTIAESWELACHNNGTNTITDTKVSLRKYLNMQPTALGENCNKFDKFPILIKLIDAKENLSIQVHPSNYYAKKFHRSYGKTEFWYIIDCQPDSYLYYGFNKKISQEEFKKRIADNTLIEVLNKVQIKKGDTFFIKAGTIHAICKNTILAEVQQNSDITYRIYDYNRIGKDGKKRELNLEKALLVTSFDVAVNTDSKLLETSNDYTNILLSVSDYFIVNKYSINTKCTFFNDTKSFSSIIILEGCGTINYSNISINFIKGDSFFVPAGFGRYEVTGNTDILFTQIP